MGQSLEDVFVNTVEDSHLDDIDAFLSTLQLEQREQLKQRLNTKFKFRSKVKTELVDHDHVLEQNLIMMQNIYLC